MKQIFQIIRGILLALVLFELIVWAGGKIDVLRALIGVLAVPIAALILLLCLYLTFIRKGRPKSTAPVDRREYLVTMEPNAYGRIGQVFDKNSYGELERLPGGWLQGVRTYRAENGSLLFTVRKRNAMRLPGGRTVCAVVLTFILLVPFSALSYVNAVNLGVGTLLEAVGLTSHPDAMGYLDVPALHLPWSSDNSDSTAQSSQSTDTNDSISSTTESDTVEQDTIEQDTVESDTTTDDNTDTSGITGTVGGWVSNARDWISNLFSGENYILPSDQRALTDSDVEGMDAVQIQRAINEMYARHGYDFTNSSNVEDAAYFAEQSWYSPDPSVTQAEVRAQFNETEEQNLNFLIAYRDRLQQ